MNQELTIESTIDNNDKIRIQNMGESVFIQVITATQITSIFLSPFEAQTLATALLAMLESKVELTGSGEVPKQIDLLPRESDDEIVWRTNNRSNGLKEMVINEQINDIIPLPNGGKRLEMRNAMSVIVSAEVWAKENHLLAEYEADSRSHMNIREDGNGNWILLDCVPF